MKPGDVVKLKSGSPPMTIREPAVQTWLGARSNVPGTWVCEWWGFGSLIRDTFPETSLVEAEEEEG